MLNNAYLLAKIGADPGGKKIAAATVSPLHEMQLANEAREVKDVCSAEYCSQVPVSTWHFAGSRSGFPQQTELRT